MISWNDFNKNMEEVFGRTFACVDELYFNVVEEYRIGEDPELEDIEALEYLEKLHPMVGELCIITDLCYMTENGPFIIDAGELYEFVASFYTKYGEPFYSTDIIVVDFKKKVLWVLFHEGVCWLTKG